MTDYPEDLVKKIHSNERRSEELKAERESLSHDLSYANIRYNAARKALGWKERMTGFARRWFQKPTPGLQRVWDAEQEIERLEGLLGRTARTLGQLRFESHYAVSEYLRGSSNLYNELERGAMTSSAAFNECSAYLRDVESAEREVYNLIRMVLLDWPDLREPWKRRPKAPRKPFRIMGEERGELVGEEEDDPLDLENLLGAELHEQDEDAGEVSRQISPPLPDPVDPPRKDWGEYWRAWHRFNALRDARDRVSRIKSRKAQYVLDMRRYAEQRSEHLTDLPWIWEDALRDVDEQRIDDLHWFSMITPVIFLYNLGTVHGQLSQMKYSVEELYSQTERDSRILSSQKELMVSDTLQDILKEG